MGLRTMLVDAYWDAVRTLMEQIEQLKREDNIIGLEALIHRQLALVLNRMKILKLVYDKLLKYINFPELSELAKKTNKHIAVLENAMREIIEIKDPAMAREYGLRVLRNVYMELLAENPSKLFIWEYICG